MSEFPIPEAFSVRTEQHGDAAVVIPTGELDLATAPALEDALSRTFDGGRRASCSTCASSSSSTPAA